MACLRINAFRANESLKIRAYIVCSVGEVFRLEVSPDTVWLNPDDLSGEFNVYSNTSWTIK